MKARVAFVIVATALPIALAGQQSPSLPPPDEPLVFRTGVETVRFDAVVTDRKGNPVTGLTADDFTIYEDGVPQTVQVFAPVALPVPTPDNARRPARRPGDVVANDDDQQRIYVIVVDRLSWQSSQRATKIVRGFLEDYFGDSDQAALITIDRGGPLRFTSNRAVLLDQLDDFLKWVDLSWPALRDDTTHLGVEARRSRELAARALSFGSIAKELSHIDARRKSIIYISERLVFDPYDAIDTPKSAFSEDARAAMEPIMAGGLTVYPVCPCVAGPIGLRNMRALAYVTGATPIGSDWERGFRQIVRDNSTYYVLGYNSTNQERDGGFRRLKVEMKRAGLKVRARDGYFVEFPDVDRRGVDWSGRRLPQRPFNPPSELTPELTRAMTSPTAVRTVPMTVFAAPHRTATRAGLVTFAIELPAASLDLASENGTLTGTVDVVVGETADQRVFRASQFTFPVALTGEAREDALRNGLRLTGDVTLDPGDYRLHIAVSTDIGRTGKVIYDLTVPDFDAEVLMLSGVSLASSATTEMPTLRATTAGAAGRPVPSAVRSFDRGDTIAVQAEVYDNVWWTSEERTVTLRTELRDERGGVIAMTREDRSSRTANRVTGHRFAARVPLVGVPPGRYTLRVEGRLSSGTSSPVSRDVSITVR